MSIDGQRDVVIEAIAKLLHGALNADTGLGNGSVVGLYDEPMGLDTIANSQLPALCVYRTSDTAEIASDTVIETVVVTVDLVLRQSSAVTGAKRSGRWPALGQGWLHMRRALAAGRHPEVEAGERLLDAVCINVDPSSFAGRMYGFADNGQSVFPMFRGTFSYSQYIDAQTAAALAELHRVDTIFVMGTPQALPTEAEREVPTIVEFVGPWPTLPE